MAIINIMEKIVDSKIETYMADHDGCKCNTCIDDIRCLSLNSMPSKYVNTPKGELMSRVDQLLLRQNSVDLDIAVMKAIKIVTSNPRCENSEKNEKN